MMTVGMIPVSTLRIALPIRANVLWISQGSVGTAPTSKTKFNRACLIYIRPFGWLKGGWNEGKYTTPHWVFSKLYIYIIFIAIRYVPCYPTFWGSVCDKTCFDLGSLPPDSNSKWRFWVTGSPIEYVKAALWWPKWCYETIDFCWIQSSTIIPVSWSNFHFFFGGWGFHEKNNRTCFQGELSLT